MRLILCVEVRGHLGCWSSPSILFEELSFLSITSVYLRLPSPRAWTRSRSQPVGFEPFGKPLSQKYLRKDSQQWQNYNYELTTKIIWRWGITAA